MKILVKYLFPILIISLIGCVNENDLDDPKTGTTSEQPTDDSLNGALSGLNVPADFDYVTTKKVGIQFDVPDFLKGAVFSLYSKIGTEDSLAIGKGTFDGNGHFEQQYTLSARADSILVFTEYVGLVDNIRLPIEGGSVDFDYRPLYVRASGTGRTYSDTPKRLEYSPFGKATFSYIDTFNYQGVPDNLAFSDPVQQNLLDDVNASLPEGVYGGIPATHPEYLLGKETNFIVTKEADIWVTFVSEGAGYRNVLGYYSYPLGQEPASPSEITEHKVIFPNVSMQGSSGGLLPGDRVYLGRFPANTVVSWFLASNGWYGNSVHEGNGIYYSNPDFNPESTEAKRNHMVLLYDEARQLTLLGFEDLNRDGYSDNDFNDAVFYAKANPVSAIQVGNMATIATANDSDGDGINDELDDFPFDVNKAFNNYWPSANASGTLAYEDLWPYKGDYDFNDLVIDYSFNMIANAENIITSMEASFTVEHIGASFKNGFAFVLPIAPSLVQQIEGQVLNGGFEDVAENGTENGTGANETVIFVAGNTREMTGQTIELSITFNQAIAKEALGEVPFNAFLISNAERGREVHLPDFPPTSKSGYLGTSDDYSDPTKGRYYKTKTNLPWGLNIYSDFSFPSESVPITLEYPRFVNWANSGGVQDLDWYLR